MAEDWVDRQRQERQYEEQRQRDILDQRRWADAAVEQRRLQQDLAPAASRTLCQNACGTEVQGQAYCAACAQLMRRLDSVERVSSNPADVAWAGREADQVFRGVGTQDSAPTASPTLCQNACGTEVQGQAYCAAWRARQLLPSRRN